jgi:DNA-binding GntR family transcriptional regulator
VVVSGSSLRQAEIAERYGVSATPVREALRLLEAEGTITYVPHRGATVRELSPPHSEDVYLLRAEIEGLATAIAVDRMDDSDMVGIRALESELEELFEKREGQAMAVVNRQFHFAIYRAGSDTFATHASTLWQLFPPRVTIWSDERAARALMADHEGILEALEKHDRDLARERAAAHIFHAEQLRKQLDAERLESRP